MSLRSRLAILEKRAKARAEARARDRLDLTRLTATEQARFVELGRLYQENPDVSSAFWTDALLFEFYHLQQKAMGRR